MKAPSEKKISLWFWFSSPTPYYVGYFFFVLVCVLKNGCFGLYSQVFSPIPAIMFCFPCCFGLRSTKSWKHVYTILVWDVQERLEERQRASFNFIFASSRRILCIMDAYFGLRYIFILFLLLRGSLRIWRTMLSIFIILIWLIIIISINHYKVISCST